MTKKKIENIYELSPMQQGILFHSLYAPESYAYHLQVSFLLSGNLNHILFKKAWQHLVNRHEVMRNTFVWEGLEKPYQVTHPHVVITIKHCDWQEVPPGKKKQRLEQFVHEDRLQLIPLTKPPLMRMTLIHLSDNECYFVWTFHHIILEGWSASILLNELFLIYDSLTRYENIQLPPISPYHDYIHWLNQQDHKQAEVYWTQTLRGFTTPTRLSMDYSNPAGEPSTPFFHQDEKKLVLSREVTSILHDCARRHQLTINTLILGAWSIILSRYSGQKDIVLGAVTSGRPATLPSAKSIVGLFINTLPARVFIREDDPTINWLKDLQIRLAEMRQYEYSSLIDIQGWSEVPRDRRLFEYLIVFENRLSDSSVQFQSERLKIIDIRTIIGVSEYPLTLVGIPGEELKLIIQYDIDRFNSELIEQMLEHLQILLKNIISQPNCHVSRLPMLTQVERQELIIDWNRTHTDYPCKASIHEIFETRVQRDPNAVAVKFKDKQWTYSQINERANQLAHHLRALGVRRGAQVSVCLERSVEMVVCMLGILKAGSAYVPLDVSYPSQRLSFMLQDTGSNVLVTRECLLDHFSDEAVQVVCLDRDGDAISRQPVLDLALEVCGEDLAYVMYTSGSTGMPKGVAVLHRGVVRLVCETDYIQLGATDSMANISNCSFDASTFEVWGALLSGSRLVILDQETVLSPRLLSNCLQAEGINVLFLTTALFNLLAKESPGVLANIGHLLFGGEAVDPQWVRRVIEKGGTGRLLHVYGPTENTTFTTWYEVSSVPEEAVTVSIGRPIANTRVYVLDSHMKPVPVGVPGELYIGGDGLARGYLNRPELTAQRFVDDPFSEEPSSRLYRTGDIVQWLPDGILEFLGRQDDQVKLRGFRIELGEIEFMLRNHKSVGEAAVMLRKNEAGDKCLVGYVVAHDDVQLSFENIRAYLRQKLPDYMVPSYFVQLESLPLTANGKVDKRVLPQPDVQRQSEKGIVQPRTDIEKRIASVWCEILSIKEVSIHDNFFDIGGHSLLATNVISRLRESLGINLPLSSIFENPTVKDFARFIEAFQWAGRDDKLQVDSTTHGRESGEL